MKVQAFKEQEDIERLKRHLKSRPRDYALLVVGINCHLRFRDLLNLKTKDVESLKIGDKFVVKNQTITANREMIHAIKRLLKTRQNVEDDYLFHGKNHNRPLSYKSAHALIKNWTAWLQLPNNYGPSSLRKTYGYTQYRTGQTDLKTLRELFNQKTIENTISYLGIT